MASVIRDSLDFYEYVFINATGNQIFVSQCFSYEETFSSDPRLDNFGYPVAGNPLRFVPIAIIYILMCVYGPRIMASRKAFELNYVMIFYNFVQVAVNLVYVIWVDRQMNLVEIIFNLFIF